MKHTALFALFLLFCAGLASAAGNPTFDFLRNDVGARAAALGGSFLTMADDPNIIFYNPAGLATLSTRKLSFGFFKHLMDVNAGHASFATQIDGFGTIGIGAIYTDYGSFDRTDEAGNPQGTFHAGDFAAGITYADQLQPNLLYGVSTKFIYSSIAGYGSSGGAIDLGVRYLAVPQRLVVGASLLNLGTQFDPYATTRETLPVDLRVGVMLTPEHLPASILIDLHNLNESQDSFTDRFRAFTVGVEFNSSSNFSFRAGYNNAERQDLKLGTSSGLAGFSLGLGISAETYSFDYAFNSLGNVGALHRVSITAAL